MVLSSYVLSTEIYMSIRLNLTGIPFAERIAGARILGACLQVPGLLNEHVERTATPVLLRFGAAAVIGAIFSIAILLRRIRRHEFQTDYHLSLVSDWIVKRLRLRAINYVWVTHAFSFLFFTATSIEFRRTHK